MKKTTAIVSSPRSGFSRSAASIPARRCWPSLMTNLALHGDAKRPTLRSASSAPSGSNRTSPSTDAVRAENT